MRKKKQERTEAPKYPAYRKETDIQGSHVRVQVNLDLMVRCLKGETISQSWQIIWGRDKRIMENGSLPEALLWLKYEIMARLIQYFNENQPDITESLKARVTEDDMILLKAVGLIIDSARVFPVGIEGFKQIVKHLDDSIHAQWEEMEGDYANRLGLTFSAVNDLLAGGIWLINLKQQGAELQRN